MIKLIVEKYCHNCPEFEPDVDKKVASSEEIDFTEVMYGRKIRYFCETVIKCEHHARCQAIRNRLESELLRERKENTDGST